MSTQLEGAELALAVARVMEEIVDHSTMWIEHYDATGLIGKTFAWRPDLGGAAGAEALDWLYDKAWNVHLIDVPPDDVLCIIDPDEDGHRGDIIWIAICRAIVAYGEKGW